MLFNFWKYQYIHIRHGNVNEEYNNGDTVLGTTLNETDLGVTVTADNNVSKQCGFAASNGDQILTRRNIHIRRHI